jgi:hypothetical protein
MSEWARPASEPAELEVFATGSSTLIDHDHVDLLGTGMTDMLRRGGATLRDFRARPGYRTGEQIATTSGRRNGDADIVRPVLVNPRRASAVAASGWLFDEPLEGLRLDHADTDVDRGRFLVWTASLSGDHIASIPVSLHLLASPSMVVTVLELVPRCRLRWHRNGFVEDGVDVLERLATRLTRMCTPFGAAAQLG